jgi:spore protease
MDSCELVCAVCDRIEPDAIIAVDALASASPSRLGTTVQISDTGIFPGSGIGASHGEVTVKTTGVPVIAIGVPTVINARAFAHGYGDSELESMFVSPKEIDGIASAASRIISIGINQAFGII